MSAPQPPDPFREHLAAALAPGYDLEREITGAGMSRVFLATERALGRKVVVKVLPPDLAAGVNRDRFRREIHLAATLQHPHVVPLLSAGEEGDLLWYTMPYVEGESLREALARGPRPVRDVVRILHDVVDALAYAHARGVVHRDIKPGNILTQGTHALVADFGVAKALSAAMPHSGTTSAGIAIGTPAYMAPEQLAADPAADHRVDLYAVGLLAYELLTGEQPFQGTSPQATMAAQLTRMPDPIDQVRPDVPAPLSSLIMRCLAKSPDERPASAAALLAELEDLTTPVGGIIAPASGETTARTLAPAAPRRRRASPMAIAGALVGIAAVALGIALARPALSRARTPDRAPATLPATAAATTPAVAAPAKVPVAAPAAAPVLTREDSMRIAAAVQQRVRAATRADEGRPGPDRDPDSLRQALFRRMLDSALRGSQDDAVREMARAREALRQSGIAAGAAVGAGGAFTIDRRAIDSLVSMRRGLPPAVAFVAPRVTGMRRVALVELTDGTGQLAPFVQAVNDSLRRSLARQGYLLLEGEALRHLAAREGDDDAQRALAESLGVGAIVSGTVFRRGEGGIASQAVVKDVARHTARIARAGGTDAADPRAALDLPRHVLEALGGVTWRNGRVAPRVAVFGVRNATGDAELDAVARALDDSLRVLVRRHGLELVGDPGLLAMTRTSSERRRVGASLGAGVIVAGVLAPTSADGTVSALIELRDLTTGMPLEPAQLIAPASQLAALTPGLMGQLRRTLARVPWDRDGRDAVFPVPPAPPRTPAPARP